MERLTQWRSRILALLFTALLCFYAFKLFDIIPVSFILFIAMALLAEFILRKTQFGRNIFLVGGNINVSDNLGMKSSRYVWSAYIIQGLFAAIAGMVMMTRTSSANGNIGAQSLLNVIPMVIVGGTSMAGGKGGCIKTIWGVLLLSMVYNAMTFFAIPAPLQPFVKGLILAVVVLGITALEAISWINTTFRIVLMCAAGAIAMFKTGYLWHEIKN